MASEKGNSLFYRITIEGAFWGPLATYLLSEFKSNKEFFVRDYFIVLVLLALALFIIGRTLLLFIIVSNNDKDKSVEGKTYDTSFKIFIFIIVVAYILTAINEGFISKLRQEIQVISEPLEPVSDNRNPDYITEYYNYYGELRQGKAIPCGRGTMLFIKNGIVRISGLREIEVSVGDSIVGSFVNGMLEYGSWYKSSDNSKEDLIYGSDFKCE